MSCTPPGAPGYKKGAVTLLYINNNQGNASVLMYQQIRMGVAPRSPEQSLTDPWPPNPPPFQQLPRLEFVLTAADKVRGVDGFLFVKFFLPV